MAPTGPAYFTDWIFSNSSNVHVAKHKDWFTPSTFKSIDSHLGDTYLGRSGPKVLGIGEVELQVKTSASDETGNKIVLKDVLYAPECLVNILGFPFVEDDGVAIAFSRGKGEIQEAGSERVLGLLDLTRLMKVWLVGHAWGSSCLEEGGAYMISVQWPDEERAKVACMLNESTSAIDSAPGQAVPGGSQA